MSVWDRDQLEVVSRLHERVQRLENQNEALKTSLTTAFKLLLHLGNTTLPPERSGTLATKCQGQIASLKTIRPDHKQKTTGLPSGRSL